MIYYYSYIFLHSDLFMQSKLRFFVSSCTRAFKQLHPLAASALMCLGLTLFLAGAVVLFHKPLSNFVWQRFHNTRLATVLNPYDADLTFAIGEYYFNHGSYDIIQAKQYYERSIALRPDFLEAHYQLGRIHFINGKFQSALNEIHIVLTLNPEFKQAYYMYGLINGYAGDLDQAIYGFSEFIKRDDFNWAGYNDLAWIYFQKGDYAKTKEVAGKGLGKAAGNPWLSNIYGVALLNLGEKEAARVALSTALESISRMTPDDWGRSYPGNNPNIYSQGLEETRKTIEHNLALLDTPASL